MASKEKVPAQTIVGGVAEFLAQLAKATGDNTMPVQQQLLLLALYSAPEVNQLDLPRWTGVERSANSRNLAKLGQGERPLLKAGPGWVEAYEDLADRRFKKARLTPKGRAMLDGVIERSWPQLRRLARATGE